MSAHITRAPEHTLYSPRGDQPAAPALCGVIVLHPYTMAEYYADAAAERYAGDDDGFCIPWCRDCKAALTPLDELGNTEL